MRVRPYTAHAPHAGALDEAVLIKDGMSWAALFFGPLWLLRHRLWVALLVWLVLGAGVFAAGRFVGPDAAMALAILVQLFFALEGNNFRRRKLARRGWTDLGGSYGRNRAEAELRFFHDGGMHNRVAPHQPTRERTEARAAEAAPSRSTPADQQVLGLFPEPER